MIRNLLQRGAVLLHRLMVKLLRWLGERRLARGGSLASRGLLWTNRCLTHHAAALMRGGLQR